MSTVSLKILNPLVVTVAMICPPSTGSSGGRQIAAYIEHSAVSTAEFTSEQAQNTTVMGYMSSPPKGIECQVVTRAAIDQRAKDHPHYIVWEHW